ncbi:hypothetical protein DBT_1793 [Dissulfuribacter thermophilus]|uniref:Uncharacterized protein n=1 Tax=Dissulfuribacter thermophilus TaxID=1156395 RepID=A0A1B9F4E8_9BACT|nr:hypothetical protein DBT_1793 [Dissulfuribacter thermophilus]
MLSISEVLSVELKEKSFGSFELKLEGRASGLGTGRACFYLLPSTY